MLIKKFLFVVVFYLVINCCIFAQYLPRNYNINFRLPFAIPTFSFIQTGDSSNHKGEMFTFSDVGFKFAQMGIEMDVGYFLDEKLSLGGILGYDFVYDRGDRILSKIPILFKANYLVYSDEKIDLPVSFMLGVNFWKYHSQEHFVLHTGLEFGINYFWSDGWGFLARTGFWLYPELYIDSYKNNLSGFIPIVIGLTYRNI